MNYLDQGAMDKAYAEARKLNRESPDDHRVINLLGLCQLALKQPKTAAQSFRQAYNLNEEPAYLLNLSSAQIELRAFKTATQTLNKLLKESANDYRYPERIYHNLGSAYEGLEHLNVAEKYYRKGLVENPNYYPTLLRLAGVLQQKRQPMAAKLIWRKPKTSAYVALSRLNY